MQRGTAHQLHIEVTKPQRTPGGFPYRGECLRQERLESFAILVALLQDVGFSTQFLVAQGTKLIFEYVDRVGIVTELLQCLLIAGTKDSFKK